MPVNEDLNVRDLLKVHIPRCPGLVHPLSTTACLGPEADPTLHEIITFVGSLSFGETEEEPVRLTQPDSDGVPHNFFGILLDKEIDSTMGHLACFIQSQVSFQQHTLESKKSSILTSTPMDQDHPMHRAIMLDTHIPSPSTLQSSDVLSSKQLSIVIPSSHQSVLPTPQQHLFRGKGSLLSPNTQKSSSHLSSQESVDCFSSPSSNLELELHPSPSHFFKEIQMEKFPAYNDTHIQAHAKPTQEQTLENSEVHTSDANPDPRECMDNTDPSSTKKQEQGPRSDNNGPAENNDVHSKKIQENNPLTALKNQEANESQVKNDNTRKGNKEKASLDPSMDRPKSSPSSSKDNHAKLATYSREVHTTACKNLSKSQGKDYKHQVAKTDCNSSRGFEEKAVKTFSKDPITNDSRSRKDEQNKIVSIYCEGQQDISRSKQGDDRVYKLPFISTDELENRDNEVS